MSIYSLILEIFTTSHPQTSKFHITDLYIPQLTVDRETAGSLCLFSALVSAIERSQAELLEVMEMSKRAAEHQADAMIRQLELEIEELRRRETALTELAQADDHIYGVKVSDQLIRVNYMI